MSDSAQPLSPGPEEITAEVVDWNNVDWDADKASIVMGGIDPPPSWDEYLADYKDEFKPHILAIRDAIEQGGLLGICGDDQDARAIAFRTSDGYHWSFSWRAWGDLMQAIKDEREGYMAYYMSGW